MSTKIYNGILFNTTDFYKIEQFLLKMKGELSELAKQEFLKVVARETQYALIYLQTDVYLGYILDTEHLNVIKEHPEKVAEKVFVFLRRMMKTNQTAKTIMEYERDVDFNFSVALYPLKEKVLGMICTDDPTLKKHFMSQNEVSEYGYWNNTDQPNDVSDTAWDQREKDWEIALPGLGIPKECMYIRELVTDLNSVPNCPKLPDLKYLFEKEEDLKPKVVKKKLVSEKFHQDFEKYKAENGDVPSNVVSRLHKEAYDYINSEEMKETVAKEVKSLNLSWN